MTLRAAIILLVYLPLMALEGVEGRMFQPMAITVALALGGALVVLADGVPGAGGAIVLRVAQARARRARASSAGSARAIGALLARVAGAAACRCSASSALVARRRGAGRRRRSAPSSCRASTRASCRSTSSACRRSRITEAQRLGVQVEEVLARFPEVRVDRDAHRPRRGGDRSGRPRRDRGDGQAAPEGRVDDRARPRRARRDDQAGDRGARCRRRSSSVSQPIEDRVNQLLAGSRADVVIKVFGDDLATLKATADEIGERRARRARPRRLRVQRVLGLPLLEVHARPRAPGPLRHRAPTDVLEVVEASRVGRIAGKIFEGSRRFDLMLLLPPATLTPEAFGELLVGSPTGTLVPLASVADIRETRRPGGHQPRVAASGACSSRSTCAGAIWSASSTRRRRRVAPTVKLPRGRARSSGAGSSRTSRAPASGWAWSCRWRSAIIFGMLFLMFGDLRYAIAVFAGVPLALVGGVLALALRGLPFSIPAAVGFIAVAGVAVLNGVVMAGEVARRLRARRDRATRVPSTARVTVLRPVLTTALVAAIGFFPMAHLDARRRRGAAPAGHRGHRRHPLVDAAGAAGAAGAAPAARGTRPDNTG